ncbi:hypothetical protein RJ639_013643, partial [Escallonia herrerae]
VHSGEELSYGDDNFVQFEETGGRQVPNAAFILVDLVDGWLGEGLGYNIYECVSCLMEKRTIISIPKQKGKEGKKILKGSKTSNLSEERRMTSQKQILEQQQSQMLRMKNSGMLSYNGSPMNEDEEEISRSALATFRAKEEEITKRKMEVKEKVQAQIGRVEVETKRLAEIREELEALTDPMRKDVAIVRKKIDLVNRELKPLGQSCQKKEKEYKEVLEALNEKNKEKTQLVTKLMELVTESERVRMKKLEELSKNVDSLR